jgi:linoleoyl-CoA desaturase
MADVVRKWQAFDSSINPGYSDSLIEPSAPRAYRMLKCALLAGGFLSIYAILLAREISGVVASVLVVALALLTVALLASVGHDAVHRSFSRSRWINATALLTLDFFGVNGAIWRERHMSHHRDTNDWERDPEASLSPWLRISPYEPAMVHHRVQVWTAPATFCLTMLKMQFSDEIAPIRNARPQKRFRLVMRSLAGKAVFMSWALGLPVWRFGLSEALPYAIFGYGVLGVAIGVLFQVAHNVPGTAQYREQPSGLADWQRRQIETTSNFRAGPLFSLLVGGMNWQIEHHLFPYLPHSMLPGRESQARKLCTQLGVAGHALVAHLRHLQALGHSAPPAPLNSHPGPVSP